MKIEIETVKKDWDSTTLLDQKGLFLLKDVCPLLPLTPAHQAFFSHPTASVFSMEAGKAYGVWKEKEDHVVDMGIYGPWYVRGLNSKKGMGKSYPWKIRRDHTLEMIKALPVTHQVIYSFRTCWWMAKDTLDPFPYSDDNNLPVDPQGSRLLTGRLHKFLDEAERNPDFFGDHGLDAFILAYNGNLLKNGEPWCFFTWAEYNAIISRKPEEHQ